MNTMTEGHLAPQQSWWSRNWKWVVPSGCLGLLLSCGCFTALIFGVTWQALRGTGVFVDAVAQAKQSPEVQQALGEPIEAGLMLQGSIQTHNDQGSANFSVPLKGAKTDGTLYVEAYKNADTWKYTTLKVEVPGRPTIDLLGGEPEPPPDTVPFPDSLPDVEPLPGEEEEPGEPAEPEPEEPHQEQRAPERKKEDIQL
ncbi:cytochrome c oxidase assembly factor Coa1 family protein [Vitiosangium sp. GDMCC 1.1324]|uniref:cytochrome c oxidase assembly factor Coa1 family protein n=1 Tax=Vitiosangium sp. (strain GDMCC 1.1324) TaxID=2138576 RepID=UPI000D3662BA|nr:cytochrome c oxidase assembly factor Coa1 family protein [Vitiosangium sp. GDMCC 1.1324]PTL83810.1 hypothetical protein DAT35_10100 [Vitiosangium sp. GDMCC 1.1324]